MSDSEMPLASVQPLERALAAVGLSEPEERTYLVLLEQPGATLTEVTQLAGLTVAMARRILAELETKGMLTRSLDREPRFQATPPEVAVEALIAHRQRQLDAVRWHAERLAAHARKASQRRTSDDLVQMLSGADAVSSCWDRMRSSAEDECLMLVKEPPDEPDKSDLAVVARGACVRSVYDRDGLQRAAALDGLRAHVAEGEQARVYSPLPIELFIVDRRAAMISLTTDEPDPTALLVRRCELLDALAMFFETIWGSATPFKITSVGDVAASEADQQELPRGIERILPLMAVGLRDDCIARELGISARTLDRRLRAMMRALNAATRFQAGWLAASRYATISEIDVSSGRPPPTS